MRLGLTTVRSNSPIRSYSRDVEQRLGMILRDRSPKCQRQTVCRDPTALNLPLLEVRSTPSIHLRRRTQCVSLKHTPLRLVAICRFHITLGLIPIIPRNLIMPCLYTPEPLNPALR